MKMTETWIYMTPEETNQRMQFANEVLGGEGAAEFRADVEEMVAKDIAKCVPVLDTAISAICFGFAIGSKYAETRHANVAKFN